MKDLIIVGAGGAGMDIISLVHSINKIKEEWRILGYLDDNPDLFGNEILGYKVLDTIDNGSKFSSAYFVSSIANPTNRKVRRNVWNRIKLYSNKFATLVHPSVVFYDDVIIESGSVINAGSILGTKAIIRENVHLGYGCIISHETELKNHVSLGSGVRLSSGVIVGDDCYIGSGVSTSHDIEIDPDILVTVGSAVVSDLRYKISDTWIGNPAISLNTFFRNKNLLKENTK